MPDINDLGLPPDEILDPIDYDAPEPGSFPPQLSVGSYTFIFKLEDDPFSTVEITQEDGISKRRYLQINHIAKTEIQEKVGEEMVPKNVELRFQRVNFYKHPKMSNSSAGDLLRALDMRFTGPMTSQLIATELQGISERKSYTADVACILQEL